MSQPRACGDSKDARRQLAITGSVNIGGSNANRMCDADFAGTTVNDSSPQFPDCPWSAPIKRYLGAISQAPRRSYFCVAEALTESPNADSMYRMLV